MLFRDGIFRMLKDGTLLVDKSDDAWTFELGSFWAARFGSDWRERYPTAWAVGWGPKKVWYYTPKEKSHGA